MCTKRRQHDVMEEATHSNGNLDPFTYKWNDWGSVLSLIGTFSIISLKEADQMGQTGQMG